MLLLGIFQAGTFVLARESHGVLITKIVLNSLAKISSKKSKSGEFPLIYWIRFLRNARPHQLYNSLAAMY